MNKKIPDFLRGDSSTIGGIVGNVLEWYDFAIYGYFAPIIGANFFPKEDAFSQLISAYGIFAVGYLMRPFGGALLGTVGDRFGRKRALQTSVLLMALPTALVGLLPNYAQWGILASLVLVVLRMFQGLSVGGEAIISFSYMAEMAPHNSRGLYSSSVYCGAIFGMVLGSLVGAILQQTVSSEILAQWAWRIPFLAGFLLAGFGLWMRKGLIESPAFDAIQSQNTLLQNPVLEVLGKSWDSVLKIIGLTATVGGGFYMLFVWWPTYLDKLVTSPISNTLTANTIALTCLVGLVLFGGWLSDHLGAKRVVYGSLLGLLVLAYPLFRIAGEGKFGFALAAQLIFAVVIGCLLGAAPLLMLEQFPPQTRNSGVGLGYNLGQSLLAGTAPMISTLLIKVTGNLYAPAVYLMGLTLVSLVSVRMISSRHKPIQD